MILQISTDASGKCLEYSGVSPATTGSSSSTDIRETPCRCACGTSAMFRWPVASVYRRVIPANRLYIAPFDQVIIASMANGAV